MPAPVETESPVENPPLDLPSITVPPHLSEAEVLDIVAPPASSSGLRGDEGVGYEGVRVYLRIFEDAVRPISASVA